MVHSMLKQDTENSATFIIQSKSILKKEDRFESGTDSESHPKTLYI